MRGKGLSHLGGAPSRLKTTMSEKNSNDAGSDRRKRTAVLLFVGYFLPGFKGGGPIRTVANMVDRLGEEIDFSIVTSDRDLGDSNPYPAILPNQWATIHNARIAYMAPGIFGLRLLWGIVREYGGDAIYLNGFFSIRHSIFPIICWRILKPQKAVIIGPRGEFSKGALELKSVKKKIFIQLAKWTGLYRNAIWYASSAYEAEDIRRTLGGALNIKIAINIASPAKVAPLSIRTSGAPLRVVFVSRISKKKNLLGAIKIMGKVRASVVFDVYGPIEDQTYWKECRDLANDLPSNIEFNYRGELLPAQVPEALANYDLFFLLTFGENFGHVIAEALGSGVPVLISDTTPWRDLERKKLGWDISLEHDDQFVAAVEKCSLISGDEYFAWRKSIRDWCLLNVGNEDAIEQNRQVFKI